MKLVLVEWQDSRQPDGGWCWADAVEAPTPVVCQTVGWLLQETDDALLLAQSLGDVASDRLQTSGRTEIARRQVVRMEELTSSWAATSVCLALVSEQKLPVSSMSV